jgi:hypothetical protein
MQMVGVPLTYEANAPDSPMYGGASAAQQQYTAEEGYVDDDDIEEEI